MTTLNTIIEEEKFVDAVWGILKSDSNDLRKQQAILNLYRQSTATAMQRALQEIEVEVEEIPTDWCPRQRTHSCANNIHKHPEYKEGYREAIDDALTIIRSKLKTEIKK